MRNNVPKQDTTRHRQIIESITEFAIITTDRDGTVVGWNPGAEHILLWKSDEMIGRTAEAIFTPEDRVSGQINREMVHSLESGRGVDERWHLRKDGSRFWASGEMMPLKNDAGGHVGFVKVLRDRTEQHQQGIDLEASQRALIDSEQKWRGLFENLQEGFILGKVVRDDTGRVVDWRYEEVNEAWGKLVDIPSKQAAGRTIRELFPGIEDEWVHEFADVVETGQPIRFTRQVGKLGRWYDGLCQPISGDLFSVIFLEVTKRVQSEARSRALLNLSETLSAIDGPDAMSRAAAEIIGSALGVGRAGYGTVGNDGETFTVPSDWTQGDYPTLAGVYRMDDYGGYAEDLREGRTVVIPDIRLDPRTSADTAPLESVGVRSLINHPIVEAGRTVAVLYVNDDRVHSWTDDEVAFVQAAANRTRDTVERRRAEAKLRASEERQRLAIASGEIGIFDLDMTSGELLWDDRVRAAFGVAPDRIVTQSEKLSAVHPDDQAAFDAAFAATMDGAPFDLQFRTIGLDDRQVRWVNVRGRITGVQGAQHFIGAVRDVSQRVAAEQRQTVLNQELAHRLKNTLAVVQSIATQTLRSAPDMPTARDSLTKRIQTLSKAHDILLTGHNDAGSVEAIIRGAVDLHDPDRRIMLRGPNLHIGPKAALTLALIMHELATNAAKYGALSIPTGIVHVAWVVDIDSTTRLPTLAISWREIDGPPASPPERKGFGTRLIEMGLSGSAGGSVELDYAEDGLQCRIIASLTELQADDDA
ncbi:PAS domain S-box protein [Fulvimarina endophytica]|uniref:Blue-light-activated histidine kinase n=1 Tax=Fulvimarina endophytica TaxID=2293836 RepID=A0A371WXW9_9HYPH|nr:PAS domain S-box protein [Fulvimarina endophytica]RFC61845.1 PAS domain S-box protein [Fulvimarina endophytica]